MSITHNSDIINFKKANCKNCFKCLRECPVKAIAFRDGQAEIINEECLVCGHCLTVCPQNAKVVRSDVDLAKELLATGKKVIVSIAPSFLAAYSTDLEHITAALKKLGFFAVEETSVGAVPVTREYEKLVASRQIPCVISSACPTVVKLIEKYYPSALPYLASVDSPMIAHAKMLRKRYHDAGIVFIGPCISKKDEASWDSNVDVALTFEELSDWFDEASITPKDIIITKDAAAVADGKDNNNARLYPTNGGILKTMTTKVPGVSYITAEGMPHCQQILNDIQNGSAFEGFFIEMSACDGSCINGPCMVNKQSGYLENFKRIETYSKKRTLPLIKDNEKLWEGIDFHRDFKPKIPIKQMPGEHDIREILAKTGKTSPEKELNCGACGYPTCREKAIAVFQGKAEVTMCMPYMRERAEYISDKVITFSPNAIIVLDNLLSIQALNNSACKLFGITDAKEFAGRYIGELVEASAFEEALVNRRNVLNRKSYLFRYEKYVEESVIFVKEHNMIFGILRDMTEEEKQNENIKKVKLETIGTADNVIEKQMRVVQEIAMLLGETTAETKVALTKLKETIMSEEE